MTATNDRTDMANQSSDPADVPTIRLVLRGVVAPLRFIKRHGVIGPMVLMVLSMMTGPTTGRSIGPTSGGSVIRMSGGFYWQGLLTAVPLAVAVCAVAATIDPERDRTRFPQRPAVYLGSSILAVVTMVGSAILWHRSPVVITVVIVVLLCFAMVFGFYRAVTYTDRQRAREFDAYLRVWREEQRLAEEYDSGTRTIKRGHNSHFNANGRPKKEYGTRTDAEAAARKHERDLGEVMSAYLCECERHWHIGHAK